MVANAELAAKVAVSEGVIEIEVCERPWSIGGPLTPGSVEGLILSESWPHCILSFCSKRPVRKIGRGVEEGKGSGFPAETGYVFIHGFQTSCQDSQEICISTYGRNVRTSRSPVL